MTESSILHIIIYMIMEEKKMTTEQQRLVEENIKLVPFVVGRFFKEEESEELVSIGNEGLCRAAMTYDKNKGTKFSTFAVVTIKNTIRNYLKSERTKHGNTLNDWKITANGEPTKETKISATPAKDELTPLIDKIALEQFMSRVKTLSSRERQCFELKLQGYRDFQIADMLGVTRQCVFFELNRAKRKILERYGNDKELYDWI